MNKLIVILGPTASGKTSLAIELAKKYNGEIVSADSRQIYKGMDIGTAKPLDLEGIPHWLLDIKNPDEIYTVAEFKNDAVEVIKDIQKRGKLPILCGGTGLYIKAVVDNLDIPKVEASPALREKIEQEIKEKGLEFVFKKLIKLDPEAAYIVDPKNPRRVVRALEIMLLTKKPFSSQRKLGAPLFDVLEIGISLPNEELKNRIYLRVDEMIRNGLADEVKNLIGEYGADHQAFDAIGYREIIDFLNNKITLEQASELIKINTWHYAKRQITWFKREPPSPSGFGEPSKKIHWVSGFSEAEQLLEEFLK
jgi:tRNA dimethylallyltransferase